MTDQNEFDLGPKLSLDSRSEAHLRHAYEQVLNYGARLSLFASGSPTRTRGPIDRRQELLALDDMTNFALHARRLIELTQSKKRFLSVKFPGVVNGNKSEIAVTKILNVLIHHKSIIIFRDEIFFHIRDEPHKWKEILADEMLGSVKYKTFPPKIMVHPDRGGAIAFDLGTMIEVFQDKVLDPIITMCEEHGCYLGSPEEF